LEQNEGEGEEEGGDGGVRDSSSPHPPLFPQFLSLYLVITVTIL